MYKKGYNYKVLFYITILRVSPETLKHVRL